MGGESGARPDFVWDADSRSGEDRHMLRAAEAGGDVVLHYVAVEDGRGTMATFSLAGGRFLATALPAALAALAEWTERREMERLDEPVHTWADAPPGTVQLRPSAGRRKGGGASGARSGGGAGRPARQGAAWTQEEEDRVRRLHLEGEGLSRIAAAVERSPFAIEKRLETLGLTVAAPSDSAA